MNKNIKKVIEIAASWNRKNIHVISGAPGETCAFFVRYVFKNALHRAGEMPVAHNRPYYSEHHVAALPTNENFADGLAGDEIGPKVEFNQIQAGDILFFKDTYFSKEFPAGSITHVGIALNSNGLMADSSGGLCHVRNHRENFRGLLVEARRPRCLGMGDSSGVGITLSNGQVLKSGHCSEIKVRFGNGYLGQTASSLGRGLKPQVYVDGREIHYKYISVDIALAGGSNHIKLFHHDGQTNAFVAGHKAMHLDVIARLQGGLHVWADGKEVKPSSVNIGVS